MASMNPYDPLRTPPPAQPAQGGLREFLAVPDQTRRIRPMLCSVGQKQRDTQGEPTSTAAHAPASPHRDAMHAHAVCWAAMDVWLRAQGRIVKEDVLGFITLHSTFSTSEEPRLRGAPRLSSWVAPSQCFMISAVSVCILYCTEYRSVQTLFLNPTTPRQLRLSGLSLRKATIRYR